MDTGGTPTHRLAKRGHVRAKRTEGRPAFTGISWDSSVTAWRARCPRELAGGQQLLLGGTYKLEQKRAALAVNELHDQLRHLAAGRLAVPPAPNAVHAGVSLRLQAGNREAAAQGDRHAARLPGLRTREWLHLPYVPASELPAYVRGGRHAQGRRELATWLGGGQLAGTRPQTERPRGCC
ncbi:hypothetical protein CHLRE_01g050616v5 [Chlamydomonas reinhardtii]|uniref:Uncharacterized protein n=1 Tax=Chlamydomonas reinhardtii TaxID=3055 RepID=A0A2K3E808_CHLRE|nr:uncharacterized protein CHLRE_01g050616v5 [Chlamydomonas reinhardtii]PNW88920.1 hypothetical protein CHLRE_01g050616v5 [Chlamydomonas reinhardtii]